MVVAELSGKRRHPAAAGANFLLDALGLWLDLIEIGTNSPGRIGVGEGVAGTAPLREHLPAIRSLALRCLFLLRPSRLLPIPTASCEHDGAKSSSDKTRRVAGHLADNTARPGLSRRLAIRRPPAVVRCGQRLVDFDLHRGCQPAAEHAKACNTLEAQEDRSLEGLTLHDFKAVAQRNPAAGQIPQHFRVLVGDA